MDMNHSTAKPCFDLEERTERFAQRVQQFTKDIPKTIANTQYIMQVIRSSGSVAANYIETNDALGDKDFLMRLKITRKEAKESRLWLRLIETSSTEQEEVRQSLEGEANELTLIFSAMLRNKQMTNNLN